MKATIPLIVFVMLLKTLHAGSFDTTDKTLPEALKRLSIEYTLPRHYHSKGITGHINILNEDNQSKLRTYVLTVYCDLHRLSYRKDGERYIFFRDSKYNASGAHLESPTILEALGSVERYKKKKELDLDDWILFSARLKQEFTDTYTGGYWHLEYGRKPPADGGIGAHHFFVYDDLLVEHFTDRKAPGPIHQSTEEIIEAARPGSY